MEWYWIVLIVIGSLAVWFALSAIFYKQFFKRFYDIVLSLLALIILSPLIAVVAIIARIKLGKGIVFKQKRIGKNTSFWTHPTVKSELIVIDIITIFYIPCTFITSILKGSGIKPLRVSLTIISYTLICLICVLNLYVRWVKDKEKSLTDATIKQNAE